MPTGSWILEKKNIFFFLKAEYNPQLNIMDDKSFVQKGAQL